MDSAEGEQFRTALDELLSSETFVRSPALARLLTYLVEQAQAGETASLKESVIGHVLYGLPAGYDPKLDSRVRVSANRLRARLEEHYLAHPELRVRIVLPKGAYVPVLEIHESPGATEVLPVEAPPEDLENIAQVQHVPEVVEAAMPSAAARGPKTRSYWLAAGGVAVVLLVLCGVWWMHTRHAAAPEESANWSVRPFARLGGSQQFGAFSPDGNRLAFTSTRTRDETETIYIQDIASENPHRIAAGLRPAWSRDGKRLAFVRSEGGDRKQIVVFDLDTNKETVAAEIEGGGPWLCQLPRVSWSLDGKTLYTTAVTGGNAGCGLIAIDLSSHQVQTLLPPNGVIGDLEPAVSPDGRTIVFMRGVAIGASELFAFDIRGGELRQVTNDGADMVGFDWEPDGKSLVLSSSREGGTRKLWRMPLDGGKPQALTNGASNPVLPSVNKDGTQINFTQFHSVAPIWKAEARGKPVEVLDNQSRNDWPSVSPDGKMLLFTSDRASRKELWVSTSDGSETRPLLPSNLGETDSGRWSPDGKSIAMECHFQGQTHLCLANADGSGLHSITSGSSSQVLPSWSRDGKWVYYTSGVSGRHEIYRIDAVSGATQPITHRGGFRAVESWDGKWIYVVRKDPVGMVALPTDGTPAERRAVEDQPLLLTANANAASVWDAVKNGIVYVPADSPALPVRLSVFDLQTHRSKPFAPLRELAPGTELSISVLPDGEGLIYAAAETHSELNMMTAR